MRDSNGKILGAGDLIQNSNGNRVTSTMSLHFQDGSLYQEIAIFSQQKYFQLLSYKRIQRGPTFKTPEILSLDASGKVTITYADKGKEKTISDQISVPADLANGMVTMLLTQIDSAAETTLSMIVSTPKPRLVKLKISTVGQDEFSVGGTAAKATHYLVDVDIGGITGTIAKVVGKQPPPTHVWIARGSAPVFLKSEGPIWEDGPVVRVELASPTWPKRRGTSE